MSNNQNEPESPGANSAPNPESGNETPPPEEQADPAAAPDKGGPGPGKGMVSPRGIVLLLLYLVSCVVLLLWGLVQIWPELTAVQQETQAADSGTPPPDSGQRQPPSPGSGREEDQEPGIDLYCLFPVSGRETMLLLAVAMAGAIGATVHTLRSFYWYVGNRELKRSWIPLYLLRPVVGSVLAVVFYLVIRGGFFSPSAEPTAVSPLGFTALAALVGMFSDQAVLKLREVANTVFTTPPEGADPSDQEDEQGKQGKGQK